MNQENASNGFGPVPGSGYSIFGIQPISSGYQPMPLTVPKLSPTQLAIASLVALFIISYVRGVVTAYRSELSKIPGPWYNVWTTIHLKWLFARGTIPTYVEKAHKKYGDVVRLGPRQIWVADKAAMKEILMTTDLPKVTMYAEISRDRSSPGLFGEIRPDPHKNLKKFLNPAFTVTSVDKLDSFFKDCVKGLLQNYYRQAEKKEIVDSKGGFTTDLMRDLHCLALDIMGEASFGKGFGQIDKVFDPTLYQTKRDKEWSKIPDAIFDGLANRYRFVFIKRTLRSLGWDIEFDWPSDMIKAISSLVDDRHAENVQDNEVERIDVLQHMIDQGERPDTGKKMNNRDVIDQMSELLLAGSETTSGTIGCLFLELARNPDVRKKLLASLPALGPQDAILDSKQVRTEPTYRYLEACIKENLRMHPIASEMGRRTLKHRFQVGDYEIPEWTIVSASYRRLHNNEEHWPQADKFIPERWLEGDEMEGAPAPDMQAYYPFSSGKHSCIGQNFAYAEIRTVSANILSRFDVEEVKYKEIDFRQYITMQFHDGKWNARLIPRWST